MRREGGGEGEDITTYLLRGGEQEQGGQGTGVAKQDNKELDEEGVWKKGMRKN